MSDLQDRPNEEGGPSAWLQLPWWEKTVEYKFVLEHLPSDLPIQPLAGVMEKSAGDAMVGLDDGYALIEFKRDFSSIRAEIAKYPNLQKVGKDKFQETFTTLAKEARSAAGLAEGNDALPVPHYIIYGEEPDTALEGRGLENVHRRFANLSLRMTNYWDWSEGEPVTVSSMYVFSEEDRFKEYLEFLARNRTDDDEAVGVSGGLVSVRIQGKQRWIPLSDLLKGWKLAPSPTQTNTPGMR